jgi:hypothetical protein
MTNKNQNSPLPEFLIFRQRPSRTEHDESITPPEWIHEATEPTYVKAQDFVSRAAKHPGIAWRRWRIEKHMVFPEPAVPASGESATNFL